MELPDIKKLTKFIALCRKHGITHIKQGDFEMTLGALAAKKPRKQRKTLFGAPIVDSDDDEFESDAPSPEDLLNWSVGNAVDQLTAVNNEG